MTQTSRGSRRNRHRSDRSRRAWGIASKNILFDLSHWQTDNRVGTLTALTNLRVRFSSRALRHHANAKSCGNKPSNNE